MKAYTMKNAPTIVTSKPRKISPKEQAKIEAIEKLREYLKPGTIVTTILRHCSRSGLSRSISLAIVRDGETWDISYLAARAMDDRMDTNNGGIKIGGAGMDMGFALVYNLGRTLFPKGFDIVEGTRARNGDTSGHDNDGGYALKHRWL